MPIQVSINHSEQLVTATGLGAISLADVSSYFTTLVTSRVLPFRKLFDGSQAFLALGPLEIARLGASVRAMATMDVRGPLAIVACTPIGIAGARLFMSLPAPDRRAELFDTTDAALRWLEAQPVPQRTEGRTFLDDLDFRRVSHLIDGSSAASLQDGAEAHSHVGTAEEARQRAARARRLCSQLLSEGDRLQILSYADEMEQTANYLDLASRLTTAQ